jgi:putative peptide zinc metalloprotease protein
VALAAVSEPVSRDAHAGLWQQVAGARLALLDSVAVHHHRYRGRNWYLLRNALGKRQYRVSEGVYRLLQRLDGRQRLGEIWASAFPPDTEEAPDPHELVTVVAQLQAAGMLTSDQPVNLERLVQQRRQRQRVNRLARWARPLAPRFALLDPDRALARIAPGFSWAWRPLMFWLWLALVLVAAATAWQHAGELAAYGAQRLCDPV